MKAIKPIPRVAKRPRYKREQRVPRVAPADGIERKVSLRLDHEREVCVTEEARGKRRDEIYDRSQGKCEGCAIEIFRDTFHWHHVRGRGMGGGKRCDCIRRQCSQALCETRFLSDNTKRTGCHDLAHEIGKLGKPFAREAVTRSKD